MFRIIGKKINYDRVQLVLVTMEDAGSDGEMSKKKN